MFTTLYYYSGGRAVKNQQLGTMYTLYSIHVYKAFPPLGSMISVGSILGAVPVMRNRSPGWFLAIRAKPNFIICFHQEESVEILQSYN